MERPERRSDILCSIRFFNHDNFASTLGLTFPGESWWFLPDAFRAHRAAAVADLGRPQRAPSSKRGAFCNFDQNGRTFASALRGTHVSSKCSGGSERVPARELGYFMVSLCRRDVLSLLSASCEVVRSRETANRASAGLCGAGTFCTDGIHAWQ